MGSYSACKVHWFICAFLACMGKALILGSKNSISFYDAIQSEYLKFSRISGSLLNMILLIIFFSSLICVLPFPRMCEGPSLNWKSLYRRRMFREHWFWLSIFCSKCTLKAINLWPPVFQSTNWAFHSSVSSCDAIYWIFLKVLLKNSGSLFAFFQIALPTFLSITTKFSRLRCSLERDVVQLNGCWNWKISINVTIKKSRTELYFW